MPLTPMICLFSDSVIQQRKETAFQAGDELRARCLVPLLESSEPLRSLALSSGLIGDFCFSGGTNPLVY